MKWIVSVADFSGVEVWGFTVMDNHLHLFVHVPPVPEEYWLDANEDPAAYAFGMRPPECRVPLWNGDSPSPSSNDTVSHSQRTEQRIFSPARPLILLGFSIFSLPKASITSDFNAL